MNTGRFKIKILVTVFSFYFMDIFFANFVGAQQKPFKFHDLERLVLEQDSRVAATLLRLEAMENKLAIAQKETWPEISMFYRYNPDDFSFIDDELGNRHYLIVRLTKDIVDVTKIISRRIPEIHTEIDMMESQLLDSKRKALMAFRQEYIGILEDSSRVQFYQKIIEAYQKLLELQSTKYQHQEGLLIEVLQVEKDLLEAKGLLSYYENRLRKQKDFIAEYLNLNNQEITWEEIELNQGQLPEDQLMQAALRNNIEIKLNNARSNLEEIRASTSVYEDFQISPYLGLRLRGNSFTGTKVVPEIGLRFSMPLGFVKSRKHKYRQFEARKNSWKLLSEYTSTNIKKELSSVIDRDLLLRSRLENTQKILELNNEKLRIEQSKISHSIRSIKVNPAQLLELEAENIKLQLEKKIYTFERQKIYYELLYFAGFLWPDELQQYISAIDSVPQKSAQTKAIWLWKADEIISDADSKISFLSFCKSKEITQVYLSLNATVMASFGKNSNIKNFILQLHEDNVKVSALFGEPLWVYKKNRNSLTKKVQFVMDYNTRVVKSAQFDAIHLDIEPHTLPDWNENKNELINKLVQTLAAVKKVILKHDPKIMLEVDLPTFYDKVDEAALKRIIKIADTITIMAYARKNIEHLIKSVNSEIIYSAVFNKNFILAVNSKDFAKEEELENFMHNVSVKIKKLNTFSGFAIHNYRHYRILVEGEDAL